MQETKEQLTFVAKQENKQNNGCKSLQGNKTKQNNNQDVQTVTAASKKNKTTATFWERKNSLYGLCCKGGNQHVSPVVGLHKWEKQSHHERKKLTCAHSHKQKKKKSLQAGKEQSTHVACPKPEKQHHNQALQCKQKNKQ